MVRPFHLSWTQSGVEASRTLRTVRRVLSLSETQVEAELAHVYRDFARRHWQTRKVFEERWDTLAAELEHYGVMGDLDPPPAMRELIGAYFSHEYAYAAAALMNPSVVPHPDQTGLEEGAVRFAMSLRAVGEGHISTVCFREGIVTAKRSMTLQPEPPFATSADMIRDLDGDGRTGPDDPVCVYRHRDSSLSATVLFPVTEAQSKGLEDLRLTKFADGEWLGTYTAFNGSQIRSELLRTRDFRSFILQPMFGSAARNKGMALFPEKIGGQYKMLGRQDGENLFLLSSDRLDEWGEGAKLMEPAYPWEFIQNRQLRQPHPHRRGLAGADPRRGRGAALHHRRGAAGPRRPLQDPGPHAVPGDRGGERRARRAMSPTWSTAAAAWWWAATCSCPMASRTVRSASPLSGWTT